MITISVWTILFIGWIICAASAIFGYVLCGVMCIADKLKYQKEIRELKKDQQKAEHDRWKAWQNSFASWGEISKLKKALESVQPYFPSQEEMAAGFGNGLFVCDFDAVKEAIPEAFKGDAEKSQDAHLVTSYQKTDDTLASFMKSQMEWSLKTFGIGKRTLGITKHIEKEIAEVRAKPTDLSEWIDIIILALDGYWRHGGNDKTITRDLNAKARINYARNYPKPTSEDEPSEHVRDEEVGK